MDYRRLNRIQESLFNQPAVSVSLAAKLLGVAPRTVYRHLAWGSLECIPKRGRKTVSVRSLIRLIEKQYGPTHDFNLWEDGLFG